MNDSAPSDIPVKTINILQVVDEPLASAMRGFSRRLAVYNAGYSRRPGRYIAAEFPQVPVERATIYRGQEGTWAYSHHIAIAKFGKRYVASWSNGIQNEDHLGQEVHYAWSHDARTWSDPQVVVSTSIESGFVRNNAGLYADGERLYCYVGLAKDAQGQRDSPHMHHFKNRHIQLDVYETTDLEHWTAHERICDDVYLFEGPRLTQSGRLMVCGFDWPGDHHAMVLVWDAAQPAAKPRVVHLPISESGVVPEQGSWFQTDDGRIWMYQRDSTTSCRLGLSWSDDDGETWSEMYRTNFQNTYSRTYAGRLSDGRFFIVGNNHEMFLERRHLHLALSDDGRCFNRQYTLVTGDTTRRVEGNNKEDGYHYPSCCIDGDRLLVIYSVNKEDIEVASVDMSKVD
jgi:hypothetical protein